MSWELEAVSEAGRTRSRPGFRAGSWEFGVWNWELHGASRGGAAARWRVVAENLGWRRAEGGQQAGAKHSRWIGGNRLERRRQLLDALTNGSMFRVDDLDAIMELGAVVCVTCCVGAGSMFRRAR